MLCDVAAGKAPGFTPDSATFFAALREHTVQGMFSDPVYGGNRNFAGWMLLRLSGRADAGSRSPIRRSGCKGEARGRFDLCERAVRQGEEGGSVVSVKLKKTDVVVIGLGAAGGYASFALTKHGVDVVGLEAGPRWTPQDFPMDELRNDVRNFMSQPKFAKELPSWRPNASVKATQGVGDQPS